MSVLSRILILQDDITRLQVDAIVNAANSTLLGGGGVDGAIHRAAGPELLAECRQLNGCPTGQAKITRGYRLPAAWVIHTVGPIWQGGQAGEPEVLKQAYLNCLSLAASHQLKSLAFPAISTGAYGYPLKAATQLALETVAAYLKQFVWPEQVIFVCFDALSLTTYREKLAEMAF
ncbi:O-acetyl-ADP-ribose deacetylase [bacterium (Candidatus Blackallbacteria) CG17_big_fil_post_rev_8_21_14_2_50_48_46]|uniref:O-acetyl-ADP-ribose deacetylase n=1 Tax=bacterium (Candidatus Blackallbacteria) CG17_big_fil_post_rev_8_21_14_2_50_48_46 TaxID=2014261 RepID=A0A2M7GBV5_9BACT|nr:MAG: O-acetyl-ADP-ribose deacetylase [bacterium (Candidatus Blackallbacteria) CG18_big_fil_WC_8_21_14_2_50_49_26]PIW19669.1 MAG: O-acetyl-ADP-ribose deacetylase [bacterium (Candidatus Blackallbacteria) CG17_big_fil_post_rev_8_21_14_2_50_48_46]PIW44742.1 MAG: O-acetyl-ADP-ribose deacetylase [bacterium (Candidatus Blackallbacteria) CG13_big_fil_rev_8_21_14_2_50_49_14]